jgi:hypothetical protein
MDASIVNCLLEGAELDFEERQYEVCCHCTFLSFIHLVYCQIFDIFMSLLSSCVFLPLHMMLTFTYGMFGTELC